MDFDFIEIGTSIFDTLCQSCSDTEKGISVEPIKSYLDQLPNKTNVTKVQTAITANRTSDFVDIYYFPESVIDDWSRWGDKSALKGCNSIGKYHDWHKGWEQYVTIEKVPLLNIDEFLTNQNVRGIKYLKIDTEGHDCVIMNGLFDYLATKPSEYFPKKIMFETNSHTLATDADAVLERAYRIGYVLVYRGFDTIIELPN